MPAPCGAGMFFAVKISQRRCCITTKTCRCMIHTIETRTNENKLSAPTFCFGY